MSVRSFPKRGDKKGGGVFLILSNKTVKIADGKYVRRKRAEFNASLAKLRASRSPGYYGRRGVVRD